MFDFDDSDMLKPCPFCGSNVEIVECDEQPNEGGRVVQCLRCLTCSRVQFGEFINAHLIEAWNRRTYDAQIAALTAKLERVTELVARIDLQPWDCFSCGTNKAVRTDLFWTMSDTTEIAGTLAGLRALDEKTIAALQAQLDEEIRLNAMGSEREARLMARLAECERERDEYRAGMLSQGTATAKVEAELAETQKLLSVQLAVGDKLTAELAALREALEEVDKWDIRWADGLDSNVERIKSIVRDALGR